MDRDKFESALFSNLIGDCYAFQINNEDLLRFPKPFFHRWLEWVKTRMGYFLSKVLLRLEKRSFERMSQQLDFVLKNYGEFKQFYFLLQDEFSRARLIELLRFNIFGARRVSVRLNDAEYWKDVVRAKQTF